MKPTDPVPSDGAHVGIPGRSLGWTGSVSGELADDDYRGPDSPTDHDRLVTT